ncbi:MAG: glucose-6-phosphate isomerase, partial [Muribaculaceae bacterium]|nr:glucose-6-phosphate isomerase [Muribaculaceae bacterium]
MKTIQLNNSNVLGAVSQAEIDALQAKGVDAIEKLEKGTGEGNDFLGWLHLPSETDEALLNDIEASAKLLREECEYVVAVGIGGSYLGA